MGSPSMNQGGTGGEVSVRNVPPRWEDFASAWVWPRLLRAAGLALRPARLGMSLVAIVLVGLIGRIPTLWMTEDTAPAAMAGRMARTAFKQTSEAVLRLDYYDTLRGLGEIFIGTPMAVIRSQPWTTFLIAVPALAAWAVLGGAISRSAATEFSLNKRLTWPSALAFAL